MYAKCIKCGSEKTHRSRIRPGERTASTLFLKPIRCHECKERFWVTSRSAYFGAAALLGFAALLGTAVWLIIDQNMGSPLVLEASNNETEQPAMPNTGKPPAGSGKHLSTASVEAKPPNRTQPLSEIPQPAKKPKDDHHFTVQLYHDSAENGEADAQYKLGLLYLTGNGALQDFAEAAKWLKRAAEQGYALAQYELGLIYRTGYGLATDPVQSYMWLNLAAAAGIQQAVAARDDVMRSLSSKQLAQAQKVSREWLTSRTRREMTSKSASKTEPETDEGSLPYADPIASSDASVRRQSR